MNRLAATAWFAASFAVGGLLFLPLRGALAGLDLRQLTAAEAAGSVWNGRLRAAGWRGHALGDVAVRLHPLALIVGVRRIRITGDAFALTVLQGRIRGLDRANGIFAIDRIVGAGGASLVMALQDVTIQFDDDGCRQADGAMRAEFSLPSLPPLAMAGRVACDGSLARATLASEPGAAVVAEAVLEVEPDGHYRVQSLVRNPDVPTKGMLALAGFQESPAGMSRVDSGALGE